MELKRHLKRVNSASFSPDGMHIVSASDDGTACIWNMATGVCEVDLKGHSSWVNSAIFSPDGRHIVSASNDHTARIWSVTTGVCEAVLKGHLAKVNSAAFSSDDMHIVSASDDHTARIWSTATGECKAELKGHSSRVNSAVFSPDCMHIVSASDDGAAWIWNISTGKHEVLKSDNSQSSVLSLIPNGVFIHNDFHGKIFVSLELSFLVMHEATIIHTTSLQEIWIPPPFRKPSSISYHLSKICLGYGSGELLCIEVCVTF